MLPPSSLIIPSRNRSDLLWDTVASVLDGDEVPTEMVVVDQSGTRDDAIAALGTVRGCEVRYVWEPGQGVSRARNTAMRLACHDLLVFIDDDMFVDPLWYGTIVRALVAAGPRAAVTGRVWPAVLEPGGFVPSIKTDDAPAEYEGRVGVDILFGGNMAFHRPAMVDIGLFDEALHRAQDNDYGLRLLEAGYRILYDPDAAVHHRAWRRDRSYLPHRWHYGLGQGAYYAKHFDLRDRYMLRRMATDVGKRIRTLPYLLFYRRRQAYGNAVFTAGVLAGAARWLLTRPWAPADNAPASDAD